MFHGVFEGNAVVCHALPGEGQEGLFLLIPLNHGKGRFVSIINMCHHVCEFINTVYLFIVRTS